MSVDCAYNTFLERFSLHATYNLPVRCLLPEETQINFEHGLQQTHVGSLVETDLVLPNVHDENFGGSQRKQRRLALEVLQQDVRRALVYVRDTPNVLARQERATLE